MLAQLHQHLRELFTGKGLTPTMRQEWDNPFSLCRF